MLTNNLTEIKSLTYNGMIQEIVESNASIKQWELLTLYVNNTEQTSWSELTSAKLLGKCDCVVTPDETTRVYLVTYRDIIYYLFHETFRGVKTMKDNNLSEVKELVAKYREMEVIEFNAKFKRWCTLNRFVANTEEASWLELTLIKLVGTRANIVIPDKTVRIHLITYKDKTYYLSHENITIDLYT